MDSSSVWLLLSVSNGSSRTAVGVAVTDTTMTMNTDVDGGVAGDAVIGAVLDASGGA